MGAEPELLKLNPSGELPVFVDDDGAVVAGAPVIAEYLAETAACASASRR